MGILSKKVNVALFELIKHNSWAFRKPKVDPVTAVVMH